MTYRAAPGRYETMQYRNAGRSGLKLPVISLGLWQNFGGARDYPSAFEMLGAAFDAGITHFDLANNYGPLRARSKSSSARSWRATSSPIAMN